MADKHFGRNAGKVTIKGGRTSRSQRDILGRALAYADKIKAPYAAKKALIAALIVESEAKNLKNPSADGYGSYGVLQGRDIYHPRKKLLDPEYQFSVFLGTNKKWPKGFTSKGNAVELAKRGMKSGDIAQTVEGSAYPERYGQVAKEAAKIIRLYRSGNQGGGVPSAPSKKGASTGGTQASGVEPDYMALINYARNRKKGASVADLASALVSGTPDVDTTVGADGKAPKVPKAPKTARPKKKGGGRPGQIFELFHDPINASYKHGKPLGKNIGGHGGHVHVAADRRRVEYLGKLAQRMGLNVGEQDKFGGRPSGGHAPNSWHYQGKAIDVSGDPKKMARFARLVERQYRLK